MGAGRVLAGPAGRHRRAGPSGRCVGAAACPLLLPTGAVPCGPAHLERAGRRPPAAVAGGLGRGDPGTQGAGSDVRRRRHRARSGAVSGYRVLLPGLWRGDGRSTPARLLPLCLGGPRHRRLRRTGPDHTRAGRGNPARCGEGLHGPVRARQYHRPGAGVGHDRPGWCLRRLEGRSRRWLVLLGCEPVEAYDRASHQHERKPPPRIPIPADLQAPPAAQPGQRPLDLPAVPPKARRGVHPTPAIRARIPRCRSQARLAALSYPLSACTLPGRHRRRADGVRIGGISPTTSQNMVVSLTLAAVTTTVSGSPPPSQTWWSLLPGLPRSTGFAPTWFPHAWPAHWPDPRSLVTNPADPPSPAGLRPGGGGHRTLQPWPTRSADANRSPASRSPVPGPAAAATGSRSGPCT